MRLAGRLLLSSNVIISVLLSLFAAAAVAGDAPPKYQACSQLDFTRVCERAKRLSDSGMRPKQVAMPTALKDLSYDRYRQIRFRPDAVIWKPDGLPFQVQLFHLGYLFTQPVDVNLVEDHRIVPVSFRPRLFTYPDTINPLSLPDALGFAGFRIHYPLNRPNYYDEVIAFLGASYFRAVSRHQVYGASARGLAVNVGLAVEEEFPHFDTFWVVRPARGARSLTIYALMQSASLTGAYEFIVHPAGTTRVNVRARIYLRKGVAKLGIAPLTSMFLRGEATPRPGHDFRPEVHDSDGLLLASRNGEWIWRPLMTRPRTNVARFETGRLRGFGLLQRDRDFDHYRDLEARYENRPSIWVEPDSDWPEGSVELLESPAASEAVDNIAAYWVPRRPEPETKLAYRVSFPSGDPAQHGGAKAVSTYVIPAPSGGKRFLIDFDGPPLRDLDAASNIEGVVTSAQARIEDVAVQKTPEAGARQLVFDSFADEDRPVELHAFLRSNGRALSETWSVTWLTR